jgi:hypothetical protein
MMRQRCECVCVLCVHHGRIQRFRVDLGKSHRGWFVRFMQLLRRSDPTMPSLSNLPCLSIYEIDLPVDQFVQYRRIVAAI